MYINGDMIPKGGSTMKSLLGIRALRCFGKPSWYLTMHRNIGSINGNIPVHYFQPMLIFAVATGPRDKPSWSSKTKKKGFISLLPDVGIPLYFKGHLHVRFWDAFCTNLNENEADTVFWHFDAFSIARVSSASGKNALR